MLGFKFNIYWIVIWIVIVLIFIVVSMKSIFIDLLFKKLLFIRDYFNYIDLMIFMYMFRLCIFFIV